ncbi:patatin-like phospholipase family protein [Phaeacidiphilus oryzae]|uniref:patatin-like phospholipase family protein n=1 Tax=Phaeacidiphilus oryzae TaxID=348818 RepID=UPI00068CB786
MAESGFERALVIGGGGVAGIAWATGVLTGLARGGVDATAADLMIGTSAGSSVTAQISSGTPLGELYRAQVEPAHQRQELLPAEGAVEAAFAALQELASDTGDPVERRRRVGALALKAATVPESARRAVIEARLPSHEWPAHRLEIVVVDAATGQSRVLDRSSGVPLVDAVAASCSVPGVWPPVTIGGARYTDGGVRSMTNLDLAAGRAGRTLVVAPMPDPVLEADADAIAGAGGRIQVIVPDEAARAAFGTDPLSPASRTPAGEAGLAQGLAAAPATKELWG